MRRREFLSVLGAAAAWPIVARAQQTDRLRRIGVLMGYAESDPDAQAKLAAFREGLQKLVATATSGWTRAGRYPVTKSRCNDWRRNSSRYSLILFFRTSHSRRRRCCNKRAPFLSFSRLLSIRSAAASSRAFRGQAATSLASPVLSPHCLASGWSCSKRLRHASLGPPSFQSSDGAIHRRLFPETPQSRCFVLRSGGDRSSYSRHV